MSVRVILTATEAPLIRQPDREADHHAGSIPVVDQRAEQCLQPEEQTRPVLAADGNRGAAVWSISWCAARGHGTQRVWQPCAQYQHCYCNTEFSPLKFTAQELASFASCCCAERRRRANWQSRGAHGPFADSAEVERPSRPWPRVPMRPSCGACRAAGQT